MADPYWNHNTRYFPWVVAAVPDRCGTAVDIGCGDGLLASKLATVAERVVGLDTSAEMVGVAADNLSRLPHVRTEHADFLQWSVPDESVDFVTAVASLHHMELDEALTKITRMLRPGGVAAVIGLARDDGPREMLWGAACLLPVRVLDVRHGKSDPDAPVRDPELSWAETRTTFLGAWPGVVFRRRLAWRYSAYWKKPSSR